MSFANSAIKFTHHAERLSLLARDANSEGSSDGTAVAAKFITPQDPVVVLANGGRLPAVPLVEAQTLNQLKDEIACGKKNNKLGQRRLKAHSRKESPKRHGNTPN